MNWLAAWSISYGVLIFKYLWSSSSSVTVFLQFSLSTFSHLIFDKTLLFWQKIHNIQIRLRITTDRSSQFIILRQKKDNSNYDMTKRLDHTKYRTLHWEKTRDENVDGLIRIPQQGISCIDLPCGGCNYFVRAHRNWSELQEAVNDAVPLATNKKLGRMVAQMKSQLDTDKVLHTSIEFTHIHGELFINSSHTNNKCRAVVTDSISYGIGYSMSNVNNHWSRS